MFGLALQGLGCAFKSAPESATPAVSPPAVSENSTLFDTFYAQALRDAQAKRPILENPYSLIPQAAPSYFDAQFAEIANDTPGDPLEQKALMDKAMALGARFGEIDGTSEGVRIGVLHAQKKAEIAAAKGIYDRFFADQDGRALFEKISSTVATSPNLKTLVTSTTGEQKDSAAYKVGYLFGKQHGDATGRNMQGKEKGAADAQSGKDDAVRRQARSVGEPAGKARALKSYQDDRDFKNVRQTADGRRPQASPPVLPPDAEVTKPDWTTVKGFNPNPRRPFGSIELDKAYFDAYAAAFQSSAEKSYVKALADAVPALTKSVEFWTAKHYQNAGLADLIGKDTLVFAGYLDAYLVAKDAAYLEEVKKGFESAMDAAMTESLNRMTEEEEKRAHDAELRRLMREPDVRFENIVMEDVDSDGLHAPGGSFGVAVQLANYGEAFAAGDYQLSMKDVDGAEFTSDGQLVRALPAGEKRSRNTITGIFKFKISPNATVSKRHAFSFELKDRKGVVIASRNGELAVTFPFEIAETALPKNLVAGNATTLDFRVTRTARTEAKGLQVTLTETTGDTVIAVPSATFDSAGGAVTSLRFDVKAGLTRHSDERQFKLEIRQGAQLVGLKEVKLATVLDYFPDPNARILVLASSADEIKRYYGLAQQMGISLSVWNLTQNSTLSAEAWRAFVDRGIFYPSPPDVTAKDISRPQRDAAVSVFQQLVRGYLGAGGWLVYGDQAGSPLKTWLDHATGPELKETNEKAKAARGRAFAPSVFAPFPYGNLPEIFEGNYFDVNRPELAQYHIGRVKGMSGLTDAQLQNIIKDFLVVSAPIEKKVQQLAAAAKARDQAGVDRWKTVILRELTKEMNDDKQMNGQWSVFNTEKQEVQFDTSKLLLVRFMNAFSQVKDVAELRAVCDLYKPLYDAAGKLGGTASRKQKVRALIKPLEDAQKKLSK